MVRSHVAGTSFEATQWSIGWIMSRLARDIRAEPCHQGNAGDVTVMILFNLSSPHFVLNAVRIIWTGWGTQLNGDATFGFCSTNVDMIALGFNSIRDVSDMPRGRLQICVAAVSQKLLPCNIIAFKTF
jgi:hypothetical protein